MAPFLCSNITAIFASSFRKSTVSLENLVRLEDLGLEGATVSPMGGGSGIWR